MYGLGPDLVQFKVVYPGPAEFKVLPSTGSQFTVLPRTGAVLGLAHDQCSLMSYPGHGAV